MLDSFYIAAIGMHAHQTQIDAISQNVANLNTAGFRRETVAFSTLSGTEGIAPATYAALTDPSVTGTRGGGVTTQIGLSMAAGSLSNTGAPLDVAIDGSGFLEVLRGDGSPAYTRAGKLSVNPDGMLATRTGEVLAAKIAVPQDATAVSIDPSGRVWATLGPSTTPVELGQIELANFTSPESLSAAGGTLYVPTADSGEAKLGAPGSSGFGALRAGYLETSNVDMTTELTTLLLAQRGFELNSRVVQAADQMLATVNALYR